MEKHWLYLRTISRLTQEKLNDIMERLQKWKIALKQARALVQLSFPNMDRASLSSSSSFSYGWTYDVFLSFRGKDNRHSFTGNLFNALCERGIHTFFDDQELQGGEKITPTLVKAIEESRIAIPVFFENYATSSFCLYELVKIIECVKAKGRLVLPVSGSFSCAALDRQLWKSNG